MPKNSQLSNAKLNQRRKRAITLINGGLSQSEAAQRVGVSKQAVSIWVKQYAAGGWSGLRAKHPGRARILNDDQVAQLKNIIDRGPVAAGYADGLWSAPRINAIIERHFGVQAADATVLNLFQREGWSFLNWTRR